MIIETSALQQQIKALFADKLNLDVPSVETDLIETGLLDSLSLVELLAQLEQTFNVSISLDELDLDNFRSLESITRFVAYHNSVETVA